MRLENGELRIFQAVAETGGFNRAAEQLHISQSAVSQAVANLEVKLDMLLIKRGRKPVLTQAGRRMLEYATQMLREERVVLDDIERIRTGASDTLSLAINSTVNRFYAPALIERFGQRQTNTRLKIVERPSRDLIYSVLSGYAELAIGPFQKQMEAFTTLPLYKENRHLVVSRNHSNFENIVEGKEVSLKDSALITSSLDNPEMRPAIARIRDRFKSVWEISSLSLRILLVDQGHGVAFMNDKILKEHPICKQFVVLDSVVYGSIERQVGLYYQTGKHLNNSEQCFLELCREFWAD